MPVPGLLLSEYLCTGWGGFPSSLRGQACNDHGTWNLRARSRPGKVPPKYRLQPAETMMDRPCHICVLRGTSRVHAQVPQDRRMASSGCPPHIDGQAKRHTRPCSTLAYLGRLVAHHYHSCRLWARRSGSLAPISVYVQCRFNLPSGGATPSQTHRLSGCRPFIKHIFGSFTRACDTSPHTAPRLILVRHPCICLAAANTIHC